MLPELRLPRKALKSLSGRPFHVEFYFYPGTWFIYSCNQRGTKFSGGKIMKKRYTLSLLCLLACSQLLPGCSKIEEAAKADPAKPSGYLDESLPMAEHRERFPFNRVWVSPDWPQERDKYTKVIIAPVNLDHLQDMNWWQEQNAFTKEQMKKDQEEIAAYIRERVTQAIENDPNHKLTVVASPGPDVVLLELALVELVPSKAFFNAAATGAGFVISGAGLLSTLGTGSVAIEGRVTDSMTNKLFVQIADREKNKAAAVNVANMTWFDGAKDCINDWAEQLVQLANSPLSEKVSDSPPFTLVTY